MNDESLERDWFEKADQDLEMARRALKQKETEIHFTNKLPSIV